MMWLWYEVHDELTICTWWHQHSKHQLPFHNHLNLHPKSVESRVLIIEWEWKYEAMMQIATYDRTIELHTNVPRCSNCFHEFSSRRKKTRLNQNQNSTIKSLMRKNVPDQNQRVWYLRRCDYLKEVDSQAKYTNQWWMQIFRIVISEWWEHVGLVRWQIEMRDAYHKPLSLDGRCHVYEDVPQHSISVWSTD